MTDERRLLEYVVAYGWLVLPSKGGYAVIVRRKFRLDRIIATGVTWEDAIRNAIALIPDLKKPLE